MGAVIGQSNDPNQAGVLGESATSGGGTGVYGRDRTSGGNGVIGYSEAGRGVWGHTNTGGFGILGESIGGRGVVGRSEKDYGIRGHSTKSSGIRGSSDEGTGVEGWAINATGVAAISTNGTGVLGTSTNGVGVWGVSEKFEGVHAETNSPKTAAIAAYNGNTEGKGFAIFARKLGSQGFAGFFDGNVHVTKKISCQDIDLPSADCAEDFDIADAVEPGTVMVLSEEGALRESHQAYDKRVAGVISGGGSYRPGIVLDKQESQTKRLPIGLLGKVYCKVDAGSHPRPVMP
jgi:hypothetical protein